MAFLAIQGGETTSQIASKHQAHPIQVGLWKKTLSENAHTLFALERSEAKKIQELEGTVNDLYGLLGERDAELAWLKKKLGS
jgi:transposase